MRYTLGAPVLDRNDPFSRPLSLRQMMDRLVEHAFVPGPGPASQMAGGDGPALDAYDEGDHLVVEVQLPGMKSEDIDVSIEQGVLTIQGEMKAEDERTDRNYLIREHRMGRFSRSVHLPETVDADAVQAAYEHGVLRLRLPKAARTKTHRIHIEAGDHKWVDATQGTEQGGNGAARSGDAAQSS
jgi:HSP20 family protein